MTICLARRDVGTTKETAELDWLADREKAKFLFEDEKYYLCNFIGLNY